MLPGQILLDIVTSEEGQLTVISPFIKVRALGKILEHVSESTSVSIFTRWIPIEIALGATDLEVYDLIDSRDDGRVYLLREIHAKAYIRGDRAVVGSANLTDSGMGWARFPNRELFLEVPSNHPRLQDLLDALEKRSRLADKSLRQAMEQAASQFADVSVDNLASVTIGREYIYHEGTESGPVPGPDSDEEDWTARPWLPRTTEPRRLYDVYLKGSSANVLASTREDAQYDLQFLQVPPNLDLNNFVAYVRSMFSQTAVFVMVDRAIGAGHDPVKTLVQELGVDEAVSEDRWAVVVDWLMHFFKDRYRAEAPSESYRLVRSRTVK